MELAKELKPDQIVERLDKFIIGQDQAKRSVAIALRNRWRRQRVASPLQEEITPKNILMIGSTGVGKTEIARRIAKITDAPFIKTEATKFTEVGYVGRDVESIIRDLVAIAIKEERKKQALRHIAAIDSAVEERILDVLVPRSSITEGSSNLREKFRKMLRDGSLEDKVIEVEFRSRVPSLEFSAPFGMGSNALDEISSQISGLFATLNPSSKYKSKKCTIAKARRLLQEEETDNFINNDDLKTNAIESVEKGGIVFIDEIDKVIGSGSSNADVSRAGVQRDLLPLVEGTTVSTKYGLVKTDHILFIASGAFHYAKPSDLIPELQGRLPIRVELKALTVDDFKRILTDTEACLITQYKALLATEGCEIEFTDDAITEIAQIAFEVNERTENIGARRLHTVMEKLLEEISFNSKGGLFKIDAEYVRDKLSLLSSSSDLASYIL